MAAPKRDNAKAARILVDAELTGNATACRKHEVTTRTLQRYRQALEHDTELSQFFAEHLRIAVQRHWADELDGALAATITRLRGLVEGSDDLHAVTGAFRALAELALTREALCLDEPPAEAWASPPERQRQN